VQIDIIRQLHDESGHRGTKGTYEKTALWYWWKGLYRDVEQWVKSCEECQKRATIRATEELHPTLENSLWLRVGLDIVYMPMDEEFMKIVAMWEYLSEWIEAKPPKKADSKSVAAFIYEWITRYGVPGMIIHDNGSENQKIAKELIDRYRINNINIASYHPQSNGLVESRHQKIVDALAKLNNNNKWVKNLLAVLWPDRIMTRVSTCFTPYKLVFGQDCVLPVELSTASWATINWKNMHSREDLLAKRARQLERRAEDLEEAKKNLRKARLQGKVYFDKNRRERCQELRVGDLVLLHNRVLDKQWSQELKNRWNGPYKIREICHDRGTYLLSELDGTEMKGICAGDSIQKFYARYRVEGGESESDV